MHPQKKMGKNVHFYEQINYLQKRIAQIKRILFLPLNKKGAKELSATLSIKQGKGLLNNSELNNGGKNED